MKIKLITKSGNIPEYKTKGSSGMDLKAAISEDMTLLPMERRLIPTGIFIEIPQGYEGQVRARSGLSIKHGICLINGIGTIDSDYRGELKIPLVNLGNEPFKISNGDRIAQLVIMKYEKADIDIVTEISESTRGEGGFGHTGTKN